MSWKYTPHSSVLVLTLQQSDVLFVVLLVHGCSDNGMSSPLANGGVNMSAAGLNAEHDTQSWVILDTLLSFSGGVLCLPLPGHSSLFLLVYQLYCGAEVTRYVPSKYGTVVSVACHWRISN